ncbi:MAG: thioredoxin domain-containing protein [Bacteroidota bacterium]
MEKLKVKLNLDGAEHTKGSINAPIEIIQFSDYECPFCFNSNYMVNNLLKSMGDEIRYIFMHFPIQELHQNAITCAMAAEAASLQGKFWEMHDALFSNQRELCMERVASLAGELNLNKDRFLHDMHSDAVYDTVMNQFNTGRALGVTAAPTFLINRERHTGDWRYQSLMEAITERLDVTV